MEFEYDGDRIGKGAAITLCVDGKKVGSGSAGPITRLLQDRFFGLFDGSTADRWGWLEPL